MTKQVLLLAFVLNLSAQASWAIEIDEVVLSHHGAYTIAVRRTGAVQISFVLNQAGIPRETIESSYGGYPKEKDKKLMLNPGRLKGFFKRLESADWSSVQLSYRAVEGSFEYAGHEVLIGLTLMHDGLVVQEVELGGSREKEWPPFLQETVSEIKGLAKEGGPLPSGPFLD